MPILDPKEYIVNVGPHGTFHESGNYQTVPEDIDRIFSVFRQKQVKKIALYFHGGLVNESNGLISAEHLGQYLEGSGAAPICFVWETGLMETVSTNITKISSTKLFHKLLKLVLKKVLQRLSFDTPVSRGVAGPVPTDAQIEYELSTPDPFGEFSRVAAPQNARSAVNVEALAAKKPIVEIELRVELESEITKDPELVALISTSEFNNTPTDPHMQSRGVITITALVVHVVKIIWRVISRFAEKRDHDLYPTVVEELLRELYIADLGAWVWKLMKDKASGMWTANTARSGLDQYVARYFLDKLAAYKKEYPDTGISLVGHSAGSIAICHLLACTAGLDLPFAYEHVLFMAPACRLDLFKEQILDHPGRCRDLRIFTMTDDNECKDKLVPHFYTHSLLYLVSGILEDQGNSYDCYILGLQRHLKLLAPQEVDTCFSITLEGAANGLQTHAVSHGGFDDDAVTLTSIQYILQQ